MFNNFCYLESLLKAEKKRKKILCIRGTCYTRINTVNIRITQIWKKGKVVLYTSVRRRVPVREDTYPEPSACGVGWPVPFIATFIPPVLPPDTHLLLGEK